MEQRGSRSGLPSLVDDESFEENSSNETKMHEFGAIEAPTSGATPTGIPYLVVLGTDGSIGTPRSYVLKHDIERIGRSLSCEIRLRDEGISREHARITYEDRHYYIEDLGSANGTSVNGALVQARTRLRPGDRVRFGPVTAIFEWSAARNVDAATKKKLIVAKLGGSTLGVEAEKLPRIIDRIKELQRSCDALVLVFSAPLTVAGHKRQSLTDMALSYGRAYANGESPPIDKIFEVYAKHINRAIAPRYQEEAQEIETACRKLVENALRQSQENRMFVDINRARTLAYTGEVLTAVKMDYVLRSAGLRSGHLWIDEWPIVTDRNFESATPLLEPSRQQLGPLLEILSSNAIACIGGFIGRTETRLETTFERGGSDRSATNLAVLLSDQYDVECVFDKDAPVLSANPKNPHINVGEVEHVKTLSFNEAILAGKYGMQLVDPHAIGDIEDAGLDLPLTINDTTGAYAPTRIERRPEKSDDGPVKIVTGRKNCVIITIEKSCRASVEDYLVGVLKCREFIELAPHLSQARFVLLDGLFAQRHERDIRAFDPTARFEHRLGLVTIIGDDIWHAPGSAASIVALATSALRDHAVTILDGDIHRLASRILLVVQQDEVDTCIALIHALRSEVNMGAFIQSVIVKGIPYFPTSFDNALREVAGIGSEYRIEVRAEYRNGRKVGTSERPERLNDVRRVHRDGIHVIAEKGSDPRLSESEVAGRLRRILGFSVTVELVAPGSLGKSEAPTQLRFRDLRSDESSEEAMVDSSPLSTMSIMNSSGGFAPFRRGA